MANRQILVQHDFVAVSAPVNPASGYISLYGTASGLAQRFSDGTEGIILTTLNRRNDVRASGSTDSSVVTETGIRAAIDAAVSGVTSPWAVSGANIYNTNAGNVGIGTSNPLTKLFVDAIEQTEGVRISIRNSYTASARTWALVSGGTAGAGAGNFSIRDGSLGINRIVIDTSGNVGIGTSTPNTRFYVDGAGLPTYSSLVQLMNRSQANQAFNIYDESTDSRALFYVNSRIGSTGNRLSTYWTFGNYNGNNGDLGWIAQGVIERNSSNQLIAPTQFKGWKYFYYDGTNYQTPFVLTSAGNLGLGMVNPASKLDVAGTVTAYTAKLTSVGTVAAAQLLGLDADKNLTTNVLPLVLSGIQPHSAGDGLSGSSYNGSAAVTWSVNFAGTGSASSVARSDHNHDLSYAAIGHNHYLVSLADVLIDSLANGQVLRYNSTLDVWENGNADQYWTRNWENKISPITSGDTLSITTTGSKQAIYGNCTGALNSIGVYGGSEMGVGVYGNGSNYRGVYGVTATGTAGYFWAASGGTGIHAKSGAGKAGIFHSDSNFPLEAVIVNSTISNAPVCMLNMIRNSNDVSQIGIGASIDFRIEDANNMTSISAQMVTELTSVGAVTSDLYFNLRNSGAAAAEKFRIKGNGDLLSYADSYQTKENGAVKRLRGYHNYTGTPGFLKSGEYAGSLVFDAWASSSAYSSVGSISVLATTDHNSSNFASKMEFWLAEPSSFYPRQVAELTPEGKIKGIYGFSVFGADGISGTSTIITGVSYNSGTMVLTFTRSTLTVSGGIVTNVSAASDLTIPLSS